MTLEEAIKLIQKDIADQDVEWDSPLGEAYKISFEALKRCKNFRDNSQTWGYDQLPGETEE